MPSLICHHCRHNLVKKGPHLTCPHCRRSFPVQANIPRLLPSSLVPATKESQKVWLKLFKEGLIQDGQTLKRFQKYQRIGKDQYALIRPYLKKNRGVFLEIGCGVHMAGLEVAKKGWQTYGVDFTFANLLEATAYWQSQKQRPNLIEGDIHRLPFNDNSFDLVYGGGVIEHPTNTQAVINELYRVTKPGGLCLNSVPAFSLSALTYRQLSGNIPDLPLLKPFFEFIHLRLLKGKSLHCGYEKSFTASTLINLHQKAGFKKIKVSHLKKFSPQFDHFPPLLKTFLTKLEKNRLFWAWYIIAAEK